MQVGKTLMLRRGDSAPPHSNQSNYKFAPDRKDLFKEAVDTAVETMCTRPKGSAPNVLAHVSWSIQLVLVLIMFNIVFTVLLQTVINVGLTHRAPNFTIQTFYLCFIKTAAG